MPATKDGGYILDDSELDTDFTKEVPDIEPIEEEPEEPEKPELK